MRAQRSLPVQTFHVRNTENNVFRVTEKTTCREFITHGTRYTRKGNIVVACRELYVITAFTLFFFLSFNRRSVITLCEIRN